MAGEASRNNGKKGGRPKGVQAKSTLEALKAREIIAERLTASLLPIIDKAIEQAKDGDKYAREWLADRAWGKTPTAIELPDGSGEILIKWQNQQ